MLRFSINNKGYHGASGWEEITLAQGIQLAEAVNKAPANLLAYYRAIVDDKPEDKLGEIEVTAEDSIKNWPRFYGQVMAILTECPDGVIKRIPWSYRTSFYKQYLERFVIGTMFFPYDLELGKAEYFEHKGTKYYYPKDRDVLGESWFMGNETALTFAESADLEVTARQMEGGRLTYAANMVAILCRPAGEEYNEEVSLQRAKEFLELPMHEVWELFFCLREHLNTYASAIATYSRGAMLRQGSRPIPRA